MVKIICYSIFAVWFVAIASEIICLGAIAHRGLAKRYPALSAFLAIGILQSAVLIVFWTTRGTAGYRAAWIIMEPLSIIACAAMAAEAVIVMARHFRNIRWVASILSAVFAVIAGLAVCGTAAVGRIATWDAPIVMLANRYAAFLFVLSVLAMRGFFGLAGNTKMRPNVQNHVGILTLYLLGQAVGNALVYAGDFSVRSVGQFLLTGVPLLCYVMWTATIRPHGERFTPPPMPSEETLRELREEHEDLDKEVREALFARLSH